MQKYLIIDGYNLAYRSFYAVPDLQTKEGFPTNAITGWFRTLLKLEEAQKPQQTFVCFDLGGSQRQLELLPTYKAQRKESPERFLQQIPIIKELSLLMGLCLVEQNGIEADDCIASLAEQLSQKQESSIYIVSADKDFAQLIRPNITQLLPPPTTNPKLGWVYLDEDGVKAKWGITPQQVPDYLALIGDSSDNIPGMPGVGPKTALQWLQAHKSLENILHNHQSLIPQRFQTLVLSHEELLRRNLKLITLKRDVCLEPFSSSKRNLSALIQRLEALEIFSLAKLFAKQISPQARFEFATDI